MQNANQQKKLNRVPGGNTWEIKAARNGTGHPNSYDDNQYHTNNIHSVASCIYAKL